MTIDKCKTAFVFTGGGSLGAVHVGMLRALMAAGERPDFVIGASVGAINAAHFAGAPTRPRPNSRVTSRQIDHQARSRPDLSPESLESTACDPCVMDRVFRISMPEIILDQPEIVASVGEVYPDSWVIRKRLVKRGFWDSTLGHDSSALSHS